MNSTIKLLRVLGSPFSQSEGQRFTPSEIQELLKHSEKNRMLFSFLHTVRERIDRDLKEIEPLYMKEHHRYIEMYDAVARVGRTLEDASIEHAIMKTIRPYVSTTVDIDVLIFGYEQSYRKSIRALLASGYIMLGEGPQSATLQDPEIDIKADIYREVAVSHVIYLDKQRLAPFTTDMNLPNGKSVKILAPEADVATIIAHSLIKEQMYTLAEYYSFISYLDCLNKERFIDLVKRDNIVVATQTHCTITALLHKAAFGFIPMKLQEILEEFGEHGLEARSVAESGFKTPHKYHKITVARCLLEIAKAEKTRKSIARQFLRMLNPNFTQKVVRLIIEHLGRETY